jgi:hypothetical protein
MHGRAPKVSHFRVFGCKCFILKKGKLDKFEARSSDGIFFGYANHSRAYRVLNLETNKIMETYKVTFDKTMLVPLLALNMQVMRRWLRICLKRRRRKVEMMMERTMRLKLTVYPLLPLRPLWRVDHLLHGQRRCDKRIRREKLKLRGR